LRDVADSDYFLRLDHSFPAKSNGWGEINFTLCMKMLNDYRLPDEMGGLVKCSVVVHAN